jgi:hypothetical protein
MVPSLIALRMTTSRRGFAAAAPTQLVQPMSRYFFATSAHQRMCSSGGMRWIASSVGWSFHEKWVCASTIPGMRKAPAPSTTRAPPTGAGAHAAGAADDARDPVALDEHLAHERRLAAAVEDADVGVVDVGHVGSPWRRRSSALRGEKVAQLARAFLGPLDRRPVAAARQHRRRACSSPNAASRRRRAPAAAARRRPRRR